MFDLRSVGSRNSLMDLLEVLLRSRLVGLVVVVYLWFDDALKNYSYGLPSKIGI